MWTFLLFYETLSWRLGWSFNRKGIWDVVGWSLKLCLDMICLSWGSLISSTRLSWTVLQCTISAMLSGDRWLLCSVNAGQWCGRCCVNCKYTVNIVNTVHTHQPPFYFRQPHNQGKNNAALSTADRQANGCNKMVKFTSFKYFSKDSFSVAFGIPKRWMSIIFKLLFFHG